MATGREILENRIEMPPVSPRVHVLRSRASLPHATTAIHAAHIARARGRRNAVSLPSRDAASGARSRARALGLGAGRAGGSIGWIPDTADDINSDMQLWEQFIHGRRARSRLTGAYTA
uniref:Uncharacterized protein n=1 Tax=Oryza punctata TaxID=4537 RepID=A0A0E0JSD3_ORYPU